MDRPATSPAEEKVLAAEKRIAIVRAAVIVFNVCAYYFLLPKGTGIPWLAALVSVAALSYAAFVVVFRPYRWWPILRAALFTAFTDGLLIVLWVAASGGIDSPFHLLWLLSMMAVAFRYESRATLVATVLYIASYVSLLALQGSLADHLVDAVIRCMYIGLAGLLGALLAHDSAQVFEEQARAQRAIGERRREQEALELDRLRQLDRFKTEFINAAAHELNTPLTPLRLQVHMLQSSGRIDDAEARARALRILVRNVDRLMQLVQNMLDVARLQSGRSMLERAPVDVALLVRDAVDTYQALAQAKRVTLAVDGPATLVANLDGKRVSQILDNLVSNAVKFSPQDQAVLVRYAGDDRQVTVHVEDHGVGFTLDQRGRMFLPFSQAHRDVLETAGTGLGLFISRGIAERHGGTLDGVSPGPGRGATFTCVLPLHSQADGAPKPPAASTAP
ncbi:MAG: HAMP domain-containing sensor histidine kinase [Candidatus Thermoplasmatota archaeon]